MSGADVSGYMFEGTHLVDCGCFRVHIRWIVLMFQGTCLKVHIGWTVDVSGYTSGGLC